MSEKEFNVIEEYGYYYLTEEFMYIRMYGGSRAPSLLSKYATDYVKKRGRRYLISAPFSMTKRRKGLSEEPIKRLKQEDNQER